MSVACAQDAFYKYVKRASVINRYATQVAFQTHPKRTPKIYACEKKACEYMLRSV